MSEITTPPPTVVGGDNDKIFNISSTKLILNEIKSDIIDTNLNKFTLSKSKPPTRFKFLWVGTSHKQFTGYSRVSYAIMTELSKTIGKLPGVEIHHFAFQGAKGLPDTYRKYPDDASPHVWEVSSQPDPGKFAFGIEHFAQYLSDLQPNMVMIYNDPIIITAFLVELVKKEANFKGIIGVYLDLIYPVIQQKYVDILNSVDFIFTFTDYWRSIITQMGIKKPIISSLLHGFTPGDPHKIVPRDPIAMRIGISSNDCVFLNLNRNLPRKRIDITIMGFAELCYMIYRDPVLQKQYGQHFWLLVGSEATDKDGGWNQLDIFANQLRRHGLSQQEISLLTLRIKFITNPMGNSDDAINELYNLADVGVNTAEGEGFGLCSFEHGGLGKPQIASAVGGLTEFLDNTCSILIKPVAEIYPDRSRSEVGAGCVEEIVNYRDVANAMFFYLTHPETRRQHGDKLRKHIHDKYNWNTTVQPLIDFISCFIPPLSKTE